jgi:hypothetical protein
MRKSNNYAKFKLLTAEQFGLLKASYSPALEGGVWPLVFNAYLIEYAQVLDNVTLFKDQHWLQIDIDLDHKKVTVCLDPSCIGALAYANIRTRFKNLGKITATDIHYYAELNCIVLKPTKFADAAAVGQVVADLLGSEFVYNYFQKSITSTHLSAELKRCTAQLEDSLQADLNAFKLITGIDT